MYTKATYSIVIRTLGKGGVKYQQLLDAIKYQTCKPKHIFIFIADGYPLPPEQIGTEEFIYTHKGMWHQRVYGLQYASQLNDVDYILALDDDVKFSSDFAEKSIEWMSKNQCDVLVPAISPYNSTIKSTRSIFSPKNILQFLLGSGFENHFQRWQVKIIDTGGFSINTKLVGDAAPTQSAPFNAFWIKSDIIDDMRLYDESWLDETRYAWPDDQVFFYKCFTLGHKQYIHNKFTIQHLDHGSSDPECLLLCSYASGRNSLIFWHRFLFVPADTLRRFWLIICYSYRLSINLLFLVVKGLLKGDFRPLKANCNGVINAINYIKGQSYRDLPKICK